MANYNKSFNFRNGVQVDDDNVVVDSLGKVGIGTSVPTTVLDVIGNTSISGFATARDLFAVNTRFSGIATANTLTDGKLTINSGIITASSGVVTFYGDGRGLINIPTSQWVDIDVGLGFTSVYNTGFVGVNTNDPRYAFQVAGSNDLNNFIKGVGINSTGDILATGIITATTVRAALAATFLTGTIDNARIPSNINVSGIVTADIHFRGNLVGIASTALSLSGSPSITVTNVSAGIVTASLVKSTTNAIIDGFASVGSTFTAPSISSGISTVGISTVHQQLHVGTSGTFFAVTSVGKIGIGSASPTSDVLIRKPESNLVEIISDTDQARISIGQSVGVGNSSAVLRFGNSQGTFDILNRSTGSFNQYLHAGGAGVGTGNFKWIYGQTNAELMSLTYDGKLGINKTNPDQTLHVVGTSTVTGNAWFGNDVIINGTLSAGTLSLTSFSGTLLGNAYSTSGISTFNILDILGNVIVSGASSIGIGTTVPIVDLDVRNKRGLFGSIGIFTDVFYGSEVVSLGGNVVIPFGGVGIGTTSVNPFGGGVQIYGQAVELYNATLNIKPTATIAFNSNNSRAIFDYGSVGSATTRPVMVIPNINNTTRNGIGQTPAGSMIFNTDTLKFQGYTGIAWTDFH